MQSSNPRRLGAIIGPVIVGVVLLASCGGADSGATQSTIDLSAASTAFVVRPPATTVPAAGQRGARGRRRSSRRSRNTSSRPATTPIECRRAVRCAPGGPGGLQRVGSANEFAYPGDTIKIPPGGKAPGARRPKTRPRRGTAEPTRLRLPRSPTPVTTATRATTRSSRTTCRSKVANKFDVTVEALAAANSGTPGYARSTSASRSSSPPRIPPTAEALDGLDSLEDEVHLLDDVHGRAARDRVAVAGEQDGGVRHLLETTQALETSSTGSDPGRSVRPHPSRNRVSPASSRSSTKKH